MERATSGSRSPTTSHYFAQPQPSTDSEGHQSNSAANIPDKQNMKKYAYFLDGSPLNKAARKFMIGLGNQGFSNPPSDFVHQPVDNSTQANNLYHQSNVSNFEQYSSNSCNPTSDDSSRQHYPPHFGNQSEQMSGVNPNVDTSTDERQRTSAGKKFPRCRFCANHGKNELLRGHKYKCPYRACHCHMCKITRVRQEAVKQSSRQERRQFLEQHITE